MTSDNSFKTRFWQQVDKYFWMFIQGTKPVDTFHAFRLKVAILSYKILGPGYFDVWARKNARLWAFLVNHFDIDALEELDSWLGDDYSKQLAIKLMARKMLHDSPYLEPLMDVQREKAAFEKADKLVIERDTNNASLGKQSWALNLYDLSSIGYPLSAHIIQGYVVCTFMFEQYRYQRNNIDIGVEKGDVAIDGGGCWGDTALYMTAKGAETVYCFEFSEENLKILEQNLAVNPKLAEHITVVQKAIWNEDGVQLQFESEGPATSLLNLTGAVKQDRQTETITIDTFVEQMNIERIDFIKMDIEGAEMNALHGARKTIARFAPKLAITVYHKTEDLFTIPQLIKSIRPDYDLYLDHFTSGMAETVLFAVSKANSTKGSQS